MQQIHLQACAASFTTTMTSKRAETISISDVDKIFCITLITFIKPSRMEQKFQCQVEVISFLSSPFSFVCVFS